MTAETEQQNITGNFTDLGLPQHLADNLAELGIEQPKPIQVEAIAPMLAGRDILGIAQTGSGKTFAFSLPILAKIIGMGAKRKPKTATALILSPTRELAVQIEEAIRSVSKNMHLRIALVLGGVSRLKQIKQMAAGADVLIATPGRLMDHVREGNIDLGLTRFFVLDEADRMLDMGFIRDVRSIASRLAKHRQTALFSATMPKEIAGLADSLLDNPLKVETAPQGTTVADIHETIYTVPQKDKKEALARLLGQDAFRSVIVFTRTKHGADTVARFLEKAGCGVEVIHGNKTQNARQRALEAFRNGEAQALIATDIAARGIDVPGVSHVINFEFPIEAESYVHRIGRTGRNGASGIAVTLYDKGMESGRLRAIERLTRKKLRLEGLPESLPELEDTVFPERKPKADKPAEKTGRKPRDKKRGPKRSFKPSEGTGFSGRGQNSGEGRAKPRSFRRRDGSAASAEMPFGDSEAGSVSHNEGSQKPERRRRSRAESAERGAGDFSARRADFKPRGRRAEGEGRSGDSFGKKREAGSGEARAPRKFKPRGRKPFRSDGAPRKQRQA